MFSFGVVVGLAVGAIIVYQILFADVSDHLPEYATLKAMGYSNRFVSGVVIQQAVILARARLRARRARVAVALSRDRRGDAAADGSSTGSAA